MNNWRAKLYQFMQGRYGFDAFGQFLIIASMVVILLSNLIRFRFVYLAGIALLIYAYFRIISRNIYKRQRENQKYLALRAKFSRKKNGGTVNIGKAETQIPVMVQVRPAAMKTKTPNLVFTAAAIAGRLFVYPKEKGRSKSLVPAAEIPLLTEHSVLTR